MGQIRLGSFNRPDDVRDLPHFSASVVRIGPLTIGRAEIEPGWRWSVDAKPIVGTEWCEIHHLQLVIAGRMGIQMSDGETVELEAGDVCDIPPGHDAWAIGDEPLAIVDMFGNVGSFGLPASRDRELATLLLTDIVGSTAMASRMGEARWRQALSTHNRLVRTELERYRGHEVTTTGDGFLATFSSPGAALRCALATQRVTHDLGLDLRIGIHTGEIEILSNDIGGLAVHAVTRIAALGGASEVIVSDATRGLVDGGGFRFEDGGTHALKGFDVPMQVWRLVG